jgi:outer membrane protein assembly factor BamB
MSGNRNRLIAMVMVIFLLFSAGLVFIHQPDNEIEQTQLPSDGTIISTPVQRSTRAGTNWPQFNLDVENKGYTPDTGPTTDNVLWYNQTGGQTYGSPAVVDGVIYIGGGNGMNAFYANNGTLKWRTNTIADPGGFGVSSSPAVDNGYVFYGGDRIYCLWANNGTIKWTVLTNDGPQDIYGDGTPTVANGKVFMPADDYRLYCIDQETGTVIWKTQQFSGGGSNYGLFGAPAVVNGHVYISACNGVVYKLDENGQPAPPLNAVINHTFGMAYASYTAPVVANGRVFVGCGYSGLSSNNRFYALDATDLSLIWEFYPGSGTSFFNSASFYNNRIYIPSRDSNLYCLDAMSAGPTPTEYWRLNLGGPIWSSPVITDDRLYVGSQSDYLYCINLTQPVVPFYYWRYYMGTNSDVDSSPAVVDGKVYVGSQGSGGRLYCFGPSTPPPTIDHIEIRTQPGGGGDLITDQDLEVGVQITGYAAAFNDSAGFISDLTVDWTANNVVGSNASTDPLINSISSTLYSGFFGGTVEWTADDGSGHTYMVPFTIIPPEVDYIEIVASENSGSPEILDSTENVGYSITGYAAGFNNTIGYFEDQSVTWSVVNTSAEGYTLPSSGTNSTLNVGHLDGDVEWIAEHLSGHTDSVTFTVNPPQPDYITIRTAPNNGGAWVGDSTFIFGDNATFYAAGYNITSGYVQDVDANWSSDDPFIGDVEPGPSNSSLFTAYNNGTCTVSAEFNSLTNSTGLLNVINYTVDSIIIRTGPNGLGDPITDITFIIGEETVFYAAGYNTTGGYLGDLSVVWESSDPTVCIVTTPGISTQMTAQDIAGDCFVTARYSPTISDVTGTLTVLSATIDYILVTDSPNGNEITSISLGVEDDVTLYASAYNGTGLYLGLLDVTWSQSPQILGSFGPDSGNMTVYTAGHNEGITTITVENTTLGLSDDFELTVLDPEVDYIQIRDESNGLGNIITTRTYSVYDTDDFFAGAYNRTIGFLFNINVAWTVNDTEVGVVDVQGINTGFEAQIVDDISECYVMAEYVGGITNQTGILTVLPPKMDYIHIVDKDDDQITEIYLDIEDGLDFFALGFNDTIGAIGKVQVSWSIWPDLGTLTQDSGETTNFTSDASGTTTLRAEHFPVADTTVIITINDYISAPKNLTAANVDGGGALFLSWDANTESNFAGYIIYRSFTRNGEYQRITEDPVTNTTYIDGSLANKVAYFYYIVAVDTRGRISDPSNIADAIPDIDTDSDGLLDHEDTDKDNDGLSDFEEDQIGTDKLNPDSDGDGYNDFEDYYPLNDKKWQKEEPEEVPLILILILLVVIIVVVLLLFMIMGRRKKDESPPPFEPKRDLPPPPSSYSEKMQEQTDLKDEPEEIDEDDLPPPDDEDLPPNEDENIQ